MNKLKDHINRLKLSIIFSIMVFITILITMVLAFILMLIIYHLGIIKTPKLMRAPFLLFAFASVILGFFSSFIVCRRPLKPINTLIDASNAIASGDYSVRIKLEGPEGIAKLGDSFNHMAEELNSVELLRTDFVNNFSHEFKTPIVSIRGFAKMLKRTDLTPEERTEYLDIIINESERLSELSTNVLNLSKIEKLSILTEQTYFNLTEQIRLVIALLDSKWANKKVSFTFDCDEVQIYANESLTKQVWINLLDNAVKFSPQNGIIAIKIVNDDEHIIVDISNTSDVLSEDAASHIFDKFFQADTSHATKGNGLGLTIAKRIVELHKGSLSFEQNNTTTTFTTIFPKIKQ